MAKVTNKQCGISGATIKLELKQVIKPSSRSLFKTIDRVHDSINTHMWRVHDQHSPEFITCKLV